MDNENWPLIVCIVLIVGLFVLLVVGCNKSIEFSKACEAKGGTPMYIRYEGNKCFDKGSVL